MATILADNIEDTIRIHANKAYPEECCGLLFSRERKNGREIVEAKPVENIEKEAQRKKNYKISANEYIEAEEYAEEKNLILSGVYHSHPDHSAVPSTKDLSKAFPFIPTSSPRSREAAGLN